MCCWARTVSISRRSAPGWRTSVRHPPVMIGRMVISCDDCVMQHSTACAECVVTHVLGADTNGVVFDVAAERVVRLLVRAGMVPALKHATAG